MSHYRVTLEDVLAAHKEALTYGGRAGLVNLSLVESAIGRPYSGYHRSISRKAAALLEALVKNHGFADGNKRTALLVVELLIRRSGYRLVLLEGERLDDIIVSTACGDLQFDSLQVWFQSRLVRYSDQD
ncbi:type II toxin-antitoxin system death-on-curing family toxin [Loktanella sp. IMCC34160]|uniref:type II toxin-antitoxin system death-on-curing family toxin n=1 Tax=Loktanella sp. IMCC34160 TaxID=2510646 RepID=UPI00101D8E35|nr:type II toxin-antitoxin system death-on-curing family toxin [Loktanella sp. IMCC34160]RYG93176.1 type II toxin-antitoxin system death-on-curing family toxin [Loktanella sp. IMCC34160]